MADTQVSDNAHIGSQLRLWRDRSGMTLAQVAQSSGLSVGYISQVERGLANPSLGALKRLTDTLGKTVGELFESSVTGHTSAVFVSRSGERKKLLYPGSNIVNELLSPGPRSRMEVFWVEAPVGSGSGSRPHHHEGEEFGYIFDGSMRFWAGTDEHLLKPGDAIYLASTVPHRWTSDGPNALRALWAITPPTF